MTKLKPAEIIKYVTKKQPNYWKIICLFGPDQPQKEQTLNKVIAELKKTHPNLDIHRISDETIKTHDDLLDNLTQNDFLSPEKLIIYTQTGSGAGVLNQATLNTLDTLKIHHPLIISAGDLKPTNPVRKWSEKHSTALSVACYKQTAQESKTLIREAMQTEQIQPDEDALETLHQHIETKELNPEQTIHLMALFLHDKAPKTYTLTDHETLFTRSSKTKSSFAILKALKQEKVIMDLDEQDMIFAIMTLKALIHIKETHDNPTEQSLRSAGPFIPYSEHRAALRILKTYSLSSLYKLLETITKVTRTNRIHYQLQNTLLKTLNIKFDETHRESP